MALVAGVDFGTASVRVSIVDCERGCLGSGTAPYEVLRKADDPHFAMQRPGDQLQALKVAFRAALDATQVSGKDILALALDSTGSTVIPLDKQLVPLDDYMLWSDHRAWREAEELTAKAREWGVAALDWCGGTYSAEWGFAKLLYWLRTHPRERARFHTAAENCDFLVASLCGITDPGLLVRSVCAMGHKWMWNEALGGLPPEDFLVAVDPLLRGVRERMQGPYLTANCIAGRLSSAWAERLGLAPGIPIPAGALDAHWDAIGAGCKVGDVVSVIGTSTCIMAVSDEVRLIPGVSGVVNGSVHPEKLGIESGLSAVGDLFDSIARRAGTTVSSLAETINCYRAGQTGLTRLVWDNGDRSVLIDPNLRGALFGLRLNSTAADELFAAIEGTAFQTRIILERMQEYDTPIARIIHAGGIPQRNDFLNQVYANILDKPILVPTSATPGVGAAIFAFLAAGVFKSVEEAQSAIAPTFRTVQPIASEARVYDGLYLKYRELYFRLGARP